MPLHVKRLVEFAELDLNPRPGWPAALLLGDSSCCPCGAWISLQPVYSAPDRMSGPDIARSKCPLRGTGSVGTSKRLAGQKPAEASDSKVEKMIVKRSTVDPIDFDGLQIMDYTSKMDVGSSFAVITVPPGAAHAESWSKRSDKYYYVVAGKVEFTLDGEQYVLSTGDFCVVLRGQHFSYLNRESKEARVCLVHTPSFDLKSEMFIDSSDG